MTISTSQWKHLALKELHLSMFVTGTKIKGETYLGTPI